LWARDFIVSYAAQRLFRPLAEGIAQFAEFDTWNSAQPYRFGTPISAFDLCFARPGGAVTEPLLAMMRQSESLLRRKASLYAKPFETEEGYLPGYIAIKRLHRRLCFKKPDLTQELFLGFVRHYYWNDAVLACTLLSDDLDAPKVASNVARRIVQRTNFLLLDDNAPRLIEAYEQKSISKFDFYDVEIGLTKEDLSSVAKAYDAYVGHTVELVENRAVEISELLQAETVRITGLLKQTLSILGHVVVAETDVSVSVSNSKSFMTLHAGTPLAVEVEALQGSVGALAVGRHRLVAVMSTLSSYMLFILVANNGARVVVREQKGQVDISHQAVLDFIENRESFQELATRLRARFLEFGFKVIDSPVMRKAMQSVNDAALSFYYDMTLTNVPDPQKRSMLKIMVSKNGLRDFFGGKRALYSIFAKYSLINNAYCDASIMASVTNLLSEERLDDDQQHNLIRSVFDRDGSEILGFWQDTNIVISV
jgi:hypothetical protein